MNQSHSNQHRSLFHQLLPFFLVHLGVGRVSAQLGALAVLVVRIVLKRKNVRNKQNNKFCLLLYLGSGVDLLGNVVHGSALRLLGILASAQKMV